MKTIQYNWKGSEWKDLETHSPDYIEYYLNKYNVLYYPEYKFKIK